MTISETLRKRISALGELSRPLGQGRATELASELITAVSSDVARGKSPDLTIDTWLEKIAKEIAKKNQSSHTRNKSTTQKPRKLAEILPEVG